MIAFWLIAFSIAGIVATTIGAVLLIGCIQRGMQATESVSGTVIGLEESADEEGRYFAPVLHFTFDGEDHQVVGPAASVARPEFEVGQKVQLYFPPDQPKEASLARFPFLWFPIVFLVSGLAVLIMTVINFYRLFV